MESACGGARADTNIGVGGGTVDSGDGAEDEGVALSDPGTVADGAGIGDACGSI